MSDTENKGMLVELVAKLNQQVIDLAERVRALEEVSNADGVFLEGAPDYVKLYMNEPRKE